VSRRSDPVTPDVASLVLLRDRTEMVKVLGRQPQGPVCIAPLVDSAEWGKCWGRSTFDHIKPQPRMGVRAKSSPDQLVIVCQGHSEDGMKAGHQWNTAHRPEVRSYLLRVTLRCVRCDAFVVGRKCGFCGLERESTGPRRTRAVVRGR
jgi:hypothetical protein